MNCDNPIYDINPLKSAGSGLFIKLSSKIKNKFWRFLTFCPVLALIIVFVIVSLFWNELSQTEKLILIEVLKNYSPYLLGCVFLLLILGGIALEGIFNIYIKPIRILTHETGIISSVNFSHRIKIKGAEDIKALAEKINENADIIEVLQKNKQEGIDLIKAEPEAEKNMLAAVIDQFPAGMIICNSNHQIALYNQKAKELLASNKCSCSFACIAGSVCNLIDKELIESAVKKIRKDLQNEEKSKNRYFNLPGEQGEIAAEILPITTAKGRFAGFIICLYNEKNKQDIISRSSPIIISKQTNSSRYDFGLLKKNRYKEMEDIPLTELTYTVFDTETTGLDPYNGDEIISIGAVRIVNNKILYSEIFEQLIDPRRDLPQSSINIHGIKPEYLKNKPVLSEVLPDFYKFAENSALVAHNAAFDMKMLQLKEDVTKIKFTNPVLDTMLLSAVVHPASEEHSMEYIGERFGIQIKNRHNSLYDAFAAAEIFLKLTTLLSANGIYTLKQALEASKKTPFAKKMKY